MGITDEFNETLDDWVNNLGEHEHINITMSNGKQYSFHKNDDVSFNNGLLIINKNTGNIINLAYSLTKINPAYIVSMEKSIYEGV